MLSFQEFIKDNNIDFLYIAELLNSNNKWIYINDNMLEWMGYNYNDKNKYLIILKDNFNNDEDYKSIFSKEFKEILFRSEVHIENYNEINNHNKVKHLIVSESCFKQSLMLLKTNKAKEIRLYYIKLEEVFKDYLKYQNDYILHSLNKLKIKE